MGDVSALRGFGEALRENLGQSDRLHPGGLPGQEIYGFKFPAIPEGVETTIIHVPVAVTTGKPEMSDVAVEEGEIIAVFFLAAFVWTLPWLCANCLGINGCRCLQTFISRRLGMYFCFGFICNLALIGVVLSHTPHITANSIFFALVKIIAKWSDELEGVLIKCAVVVAAVMAYTFRKQLIALLGYDEMLIRADLRDILTCFVMNRFRTIEVSIWKIQGLLPATVSPLSPESIMGTRSLYARVVSGYNEPQHSRPHDNCTNSLVLRERFTLNYDPEDNTQKLSIIVKQQEVMGAAVAQLAPAAGAMVGGAVGAVTFLGPAGGAAAGAVTGVGCANSLGPEVGRVDLSSAMINRLRSTEARKATMTSPAVKWHEDYFVKVDLVPQGECWLRISDVIT